MKKYKTIICLIIFLSCSTSAQYLEVRRSATVKDQPNRNAVIIERLEKGDCVILMDNGQQNNGYYKVRVTTNDHEGWIYRTLVRRFEGSLPDNQKISGTSLSFDPVPTDYYSATANLTGEELKAALHVIIKEHKEFSYGKVWDILKVTDVDPSDHSKVIGIYSGFSMDANSQYNGGKGWNREHVWAKSRGDFGIRIGAGTDIHHLRAEDVSTNSARNNRSFDECDIQYIDKSGNYQGTTSSFTSSSAEWSWEPRDEVKGDVARMMFYMVVRYEGEDGEPDLELVDTTPKKDVKKAEHGKESTLLKWHKDDPVDDIERYRNHVIYKDFQLNRNPFIDHPEFVNKIWNK